jgi:hypothetical protein
MLGKSGNSIVFGGDVFISRFAYKTKLPFFIDNRVNAPDDSDIFYDELGNVGFPKYWHSSRSILEDYFGVPVDDVVMKNLISYKAHNFDCPNDPASVPPETGGSARTFYDGYFYLFAYGIPSFYCESTYNVDLRQAFNNREGDFWPHVSSGIPDDWLQETNVTIAQDNTYYYNTTFSKQNTENAFTHLPPDWEDDLCFTYYPFRAIYSDAATANADNRINNWLIYRALSYHDFPQNYGNLISLDGIQNKAILARFENKSLLYNNLLTIDTSNPQAAYIGNPRLFDAAPPIDFAETDLGYVGTQNKFLLRIPQGQVTVDAKRGQVFLIAGGRALDLTAFASGVNRFMRNHLPFEILRYFKTIDTDNHYNGVGLHGVYDSKFERIIITKLDYIPLTEDVKYNEEEQYFYIIDVGGIERKVYLQDQNYFCNKSWTISFDFNTKSWISFHSYLPNFYIGDNVFFYSGINGCCEDNDGPDFEVLVGELQPPVPETTSSSTTLPSKTTDTTTTTLDCDLSGGTFVETSCELEGTAVITVPSPTTTTICQRTVTNTFGLFEGYQIVGESAVITTGSAEDACAASNFVPLVINPEDPAASVLAITFQAQGTTLTPGQVLYYGTDTDCTFVPDGWYYTTETASNNTVFQVVSGVIQQLYDCACVVTTTSTTTVVPFMNECCSILLDIKDDTLVSLNINESISTLTVPGYSTSTGVAVTSSKLFSINGTIEEWDITLNPFTATFSRSIALPGGFTTSSGIAALNNTTLIATDDSVSPEEIVELDITTLTAVSTTQFALQANRTATSNPLYTTDGKLVIVNRDSVSTDYYLSQYDYATGVLEVDANIGSVQGIVLFDCDCVVWLMTPNSDVYYISPDSTHTPILGINLGESITTGSQILSCVGKSLTNPTTTTTTTPAPTTTTTTTLCGTCLEYEVSGPTAIYYNDCYGNQQTLVVPSGQTENVCSCSAIPGATLIGLCGGVTTTTTTTLTPPAPPTTTTTTTAAGPDFTASMVASYNFNSDFTDYTGNHDLTAIGPPKAGVPGGVVSDCAEFDGSSDYLTAADSDDFSMTDGVSDVPFSISLWVNYDTIPSSGSKRIVSKWGPSGFEWTLVRTSSSTLVFAISDGVNTANQIRVEKTLSFSQSTWYNYIITYDGSGLASGIEFYINGVDGNFPSETRGTYNGTSNTSQNLIIATEDGDLTKTLDGKIDELHIWKNRELTPTEVLTIYNTENAGKSILPPNYLPSLVASYNFDSDFTDYTGNHNLTSFNGATAAVAGGVVSDCAEFDGVDDYAQAPDSNDFSMTDGVDDIPFSVSLWVNFDALPTGNGNIVEKSNYSSAREWSILYSNFDGGITFLLRSPDGSQYLKITDNTITHSTGVWYHYVFTYDGSELVSGITCYRDGAPQSVITSSLNYSGMTNSSGVLWIGGMTTKYTDCKIDELHIWKNRELSASEVLDIYNTENSGNSILP